MSSHCSYKSLLVTEEWLHKAQTRFLKTIVPNRRHTVYSTATTVVTRHMLDKEGITYIYVKTRGLKKGEGVCSKGVIC